MPFVFILAHLIAIILLVRTVWWSYKNYSIPMTTHDLPVLGIWVLLLFGTISLSIFYPLTYLIIGSLFGMFQFVLESIEIPGRPNYSFLGKLISSLSVVFFWPELGSFTFFCLWHADKIIDEEPEP